MTKFLAQKILKDEINLQTHEKKCQKTSFLDFQAEYRLKND